MNPKFASGSVVCKLGDDPRDPHARLVVMSVDVAGRTALCRGASRDLKIIDVALLRAVDPGAAAPEEERSPASEPRRR